MLVVELLCWWLARLSYMPRHPCLLFHINTDIGCIYQNRKITVNALAEKIINEKESGEVVCILEDITKDDVCKLLCIIPLLLNHKSWVVRAETLDIIGSFELLEYEKQVHKKMNDSNENITVRSYAMVAYYDLLQERALPVIKEIMKSPLIQLRIDALVLYYIETQSKESLNEIRRIVTRANCSRLHQHSVITLLDYYLDIKTYPEVIALLKEIKKTTKSLGVKGTIRAKLA